GGDASNRAERDGRTALAAAALEDGAVFGVDVTDLDREVAVTPRGEARIDGGGRIPLEREDRVTAAVGSRRNLLEVEHATVEVVERGLVAHLKMETDSFHPLVARRDEHDTVAVGVDELAALGRTGPRDAEFAIAGDRRLLEGV